MWWLTLIDGPLPIGDIIYLAGFSVLVVSSLVLIDKAITNNNEIKSGTQNNQAQVKKKAVLNAGIYKPSSRKIKINMSHIISGHSASGNRGGPRKDRFPRWMTPAMIEKAIRLAYDNAKKAGPLQYSWENGQETVRQLFRGKWIGGIIEFWYNYTTKTIETAWPK